MHSCKLTSIPIFSQFRNNKWPLKSEKGITLGGIFNDPQKLGQIFSYNDKEKTIKDNPKEKSNRK